MPQKRTGFMHVDITIHYTVPKDRSHYRIYQEVSWG
jgi:hypothetical protein